MNEDEIKAHVCLADGSQLMDPIYAPHQDRAEKHLKERCRVCWHLRAFFPTWVTNYVGKWRAERNQAGAALPHDDLGGVGADHARGSVAG